MAKIAELQTDPHRYGTYKKSTDTYVTDFDYGFIVYTVVERYLKIIVLRVSAPGA